jgi:hypothetical protein
MGRGGMGRVFAARRSDGHYEQRAAIKVLLGYTGPDVDFLLELNSNSSEIRHLQKTFPASLTPCTR